MGALLLAIASILKWILTPIMWGYGTIMSLIKKENNKYDTELAISKDCYGNVLGQYLFNQILANGYKFGNRKETISSVLGKNERDGTLTWLGKIIANFLNNRQKDHCKNSIDNNVGG